MFLRGRVTQLERWSEEAGQQVNESFEAVEAKIDGIAKSTTVCGEVLMAHLNQIRGQLRGSIRAEEATRFAGDQALVGRLDQDAEIISSLRAALAASQNEVAGLIMDMAALRKTVTELQLHFAVHGENQAKDKETQQTLNRIFAEEVFPNCKMGLAPKPKATFKPFIAGDGESEVDTPKTNCTLALTSKTKTCWARKILDGLSATGDWVLVSELGNGRAFSKALRVLLKEGLVRPVRSSSKKTTGLPQEVKITSRGCTAVCHQWNSLAKYLKR